MVTRRQLIAAVVAALLPGRHTRPTVAAPSLAPSAGWEVNRWQQGPVMFTPNTLSGWTTKRTMLDLTGSEAIHKADAKCIRAGRVRERYGLKPWERAQLRRMGCKKVDGQWRTRTIAQA